jgi:DNA-binding response OmpR family regulator
MVNKAVMVVDRDANTLETLAVMLKRQGLAVLKAQDAESVLHVVRSLKPDLFLVNVSLRAADLDGYDLCRRLRANRHTANTPVILFSTANTSHAHQHALASGADLFIAKENGAHELIRAVRALIERNGQPQAL